MGGKRQKFPPCSDEKVNANRMMLIHPRMMALTVHISISSLSLSKRSLRERIIKSSKHVLYLVKLGIVS